MGDIAREVGTSRTTVSYVLSNKPETIARISDETQLKVLEAAKRLGYIRSNIGTALKRGYSDFIIFLVVRWDVVQYYSATVAETTKIAAANKLAVIVHVASDDDEAKAFLETVPSFSPYGLIVAWDTETPPSAVLEELMGAGIPVIEMMPSTSPKLPCITIDRVSGYREATRYLISLGHTKIGFIQESYCKIRTSAQKLEGYRLALEEADIPYDAELVSGSKEQTFEAGKQAFASLIRNRPDITAVLTTSDAAGLGVIAACRKLGISVPDEMSVVGLGASPETLYFEPHLASLEFPVLEMAKSIVNELIKQRQSETLSATTAKYLPLRFLPRQTIGPARKSFLNI